jgi:mRNA-degrading endonuclease toxin of MazEF toxin-antitoxin module
VSHDRSRGTAIAQRRRPGPARNGPLGLAPVPPNRRPSIGHESVVSCDNIVTIDQNALGERIGYLLLTQEALLATAIHAAFDLE